MKKRFCWALLAVSVAIALCSCATGTDIDAKNDDGSPIWTTVVPESNRVYYGVGSAKLSNVQNSQSAADTRARSDLSRKLETTIKDATGVYTNEAAGEIVQAYEQITLEVVNLTMRGVVVEQRWIAPDGTCWSLVSFPIKDVDDNMAIQANDYKNKLIEKKISIDGDRKALLDRIDYLEEALKIALASNEDEASTDAEDIYAELAALLASYGATDSAELKNAVSNYADREISRIQNEVDSINPDAIATAVAAKLVENGYLTD